MAQVSLKTAHGFLSFQPPAPGSLAVTLEYRPDLSEPGPYELFDVVGLTPVPPPVPPVPPVPPPNPLHVATPGPLTPGRAEQVVRATGQEFPQLLATFSSDAAATDAAEELLLRTIWHLQLAGFQAARQQNPSGLISNDKLCIYVGYGTYSQWTAYDIFSLGYANVPTTVHFVEISGANPISDPGLAD